MNKTEKIAETLVQHNKSLELIHELCSNLASSNDDLRKRVADLEARVAYFTKDDAPLIIARH